MNRQMDAIIATLPDVYNRQRARYGLPPLRVDEVHNQSATTKAQHMADLDYFAHDEPDGTPVGRFSREAGCTASLIGECCANGVTAKALASYPAETWMTSPGHRRAMLGDWDTFGFGYAQGSRMLLVCHYGSERNWSIHVPIADMHKKTSEGYEFNVRFFSDYTLLEWPLRSDITEAWPGTWSAKPWLKLTIGDEEKVYQPPGEVVGTKTFYQVPAFYTHEYVNGEPIVRDTLKPRYSDETAEVLYKVLKYAY